MKLLLERESVYTPEFRDNKAEDEPVEITMRQLTTGQRQKLMALDPVNFAVHEATSSNGHADRRFEFDVDYEGIFKAAVVKIANLEVNGEAITTPDAVLTAPGLNDLFMEVIMEVVRQNARKEGDLKNS